MTDAPTTAAPMRHCPECGMNTRKVRCPDDHAPTIVLGGFERDALSFRPDEIVAGRYRITGTLARGGYSAVYAASHHSTRQPTAIKMLSIQHDVDAMRKVVRRFWREAQITARMTSPHTVRIIDVGQVEDGPLFIAMERLRGRTLGSFLQGLFKQDLVMTQDEAIGLAVPVLRCLEEAHSLGLVHRDLKPNNIMLARVGADDNIVKVLDFGVARVKDSSLTADGNTLGTPAYMSPEQFRGARVDARSDLYSLGVMLFLAVCGRLPFREKNIHALGMQHLNDPVPDPRQFGRTELSEAFVDALMCVLRKDPSERYQSARTMRQALELVQGGAAARLSVAQIQLGQAGKALIDESVSARDSQAFLLSDQTDDATIGIHEIDATIGVEEMEAGSFAEALNAEREPADPPDESSQPMRGGAAAVVPELGGDTILTSTDTPAEFVLGGSDPNHPTDEHETLVDEGSPAMASTDELEDAVNAHTPAAAIDTSDGGGLPGDNGHTPAPKPSLAVASTAEDKQLGRRVTEALGALDGEPGWHQQGDPESEPEFSLEERSDTLPLYTATPSVGRMLLQDTTERPFSAENPERSTDPLPRRPPPDDLHDQGTPSPGVPTV